MNREAAPADHEVLAGLVERVTIHNDQNGFCVLRVKARGHRDLVTVVGHAAAIAADEWITVAGEWVNDRTHGQQFAARFLRTSTPTSADGIEKYLGPGMIRGIGPVYARKMVKAFGEKVFDIIEDTPERLSEVEGIGPVPGVLAVGAEGAPGAPSSFSNIAPQALLYAPGEAIDGAWSDPCCTRVVSGTSFAAPQVAAAFALLRQAFASQSASVRIVGDDDDAATIAAADPNKSPRMCRYAPRTLSECSAPACSNRADTALATNPATATQSMMPVATGSGCRKRSTASHTMAAEMASKVAPLSSAARISQRR